MGALLTAVARSPAGAWDARRFPFSLPALGGIAAGGALDLDAPVTLFIGENGTGKSTLLEAVAVAAEVRALYLLDEPEAALSPQRQLAFVGLVLERVRTGASS